MQIVRSLLLLLIIRMYVYVIRSFFLFSAAASICFFYGAKNYLADMRMQGFSQKKKKGYENRWYALFFFFFLGFFGKMYKYTAPVLSEM